MYNRLCVTDRSMPFWCVANPLSDPFGGPVQGKPDSLEVAHTLAWAKGQGLIEATSFHDDDLVPWDPRNPEDDLDPTAETAVTELLEESHVPPDMTLVRAVLGTGRQHQVRATLHSLGFPLVGDKLYGPDERLFLKIKSQTLTDADRALLRFGRQALHAAVLEFRHPFTGELLHFESPFPWGGQALH